jgi:hypothetical protein
MTYAEQLARIAEKEEAAYAAIEPPRGYKPRPEGHPLVVEARRVLAECEEERRELARSHVPTCP